MINLLPYDEKEKVLKERLRRVIVVMSLALASILSIGIILMFPAYIYLYFQRQGVDRQLISARQEAGKNEAGNLKNEVAGINTKLVILENARKNSSSYTKIFIKIIKAMPDGISLNSLSYSSAKGTAGATIALDGKSLTRGAFLKFKKGLEDSGDFLRVDSPVSNLLSENNVNFNLMLIFK